MNKIKGNLPLVYLHPGEYRFSQTPEVITTVLGSCVSVTMHVKRLKIGAISHALLPNNRDNIITKSEYIDKNESDTKYNLKYVDDSIYFMLKNFEKYNISRMEIDIKVFGGANLLMPNIKGNVGSISVGKQNIETALKTLENERLEILASDLGGNRGRKLFFFTGTGEVYIKQLGKRETAALI